VDINKFFQTANLATLEELINDSQQENLFMDFKTISKSEFSRDDRKTLAKALSGFSNSSGGLIVWGVDARKNEDGVDCAVAKKEIDQLALFMSKLEQLTGELANPIVDNVNHKAIKSTNDKGFAITLIPESYVGPHMAKGGEDRYYKRSGDSFYRMEHFDLEDMFGRRKKPVLQLTTKIAKTGSAGVESWLSVILGIKNVGRGSAKAPYLSVTISHPYSINNKYGIDGNGNFGLDVLKKSHGTDENIYGGTANFVLHPGTHVDVTAINLKIIPRSQEIPDIEIKYKITAEDVVLVEDHTFISRDELLSYAH
jgi:hypothetical protein